MKGILFAVVGGEFSMMLYVLVCSFCLIGLPVVSPPRGARLHIHLAL